MHLALAHIVKVLDKRWMEPTSTPLQEAAPPLTCKDVARAGVEPATFRFSGGRSYQLSYLAVAGRRAAGVATLTGLEPATSAVTGRRANQLRYRAMLVKSDACGAYRACRNCTAVPPTGFEPALPP